jgi:hypothetical protein
MNVKPSKEWTNSEQLFKSVDKELTSEYVDFFEHAAAEFFDLYREAELDGSEDAVRCRMIAAMRLAQYGLSLFSFFSSCTKVLADEDSKADAEACNAAGKVVSMMFENKIDQWVSRAKKSQN